MSPGGLAVTENTMKEPRDLHLDILSDYFYQDIVRGDNHPEPATVHAYIETVLDQHYHLGHQDKYCKCIDDDLELAHAPDPVREAIHASMDSYLERLSTRRGEAKDVDSTDEVFEEVGSADECLTSTSRSN
ncbi:hypothetical protein V1504DRAFT_466405 [Lipomyces starkeyi]